MALIFVLSAQPGLRVSDDPGVDEPIRHVAHVLVFGVLALLSPARPQLGEPQAPGRWRHAVLAIVLATLYGVTDEVHQTYVPQRTGHLVDVGWDLLGAVAGHRRPAGWRGGVAEARLSRCGAGLSRDPTHRCGTAAMPSPRSAGSDRVPLPS